MAELAWSSVVPAQIGRWDCSPISFLLLPGDWGERLFERPNVIGPPHRKGRWRKAVEGRSPRTQSAPLPQKQTLVFCFSPLIHAGEPGAGVHHPDLLLDALSSPNWRKCKIILCGFPLCGCYRLRMTPDHELLRRYAEIRSEEAFTELVQRHLGLVYSAALRQVNGDAHLAEDVAQTVFSDLARQARGLSRRAVLTGWLYTSTYYAAAKAVRTEPRRRAREQEAQSMHE